MESSKPEKPSSSEIDGRQSIESSDQAESGRSNYQIAKLFATDHIDENEHTEISGQMQTPAIAGRQQIERLGRQDDEPRFIPISENLFRSWAKQAAELDILHQEKLDLQTEIGRLGNVHALLSEQLAHVTRVKNELELKVLEPEKQLELRKVENGKLEELNEALKLKVHEFAKEVGEKKKELRELSRINDGLCKDLTHATEDIRAREKTIKAFQAEVQKFAAIELRKKVLEAEVDKLKEDLENAQEQIKEMVTQQGEMAMEIYQNPTTKQEGDSPLPSLEAEIWELVTVNARDQVEEGEHTPDDVASSSERTKNSEPAAKADKTDVGTQKTNFWNAESQEKPEGNKSTSKIVQTSDSSGSDTDAKAVKLESSIYSSQTLETLTKEGDLTLPEKSLADPMPSTFIDSTGSIMIPGRRIDSMYVWPPAPRTDSSVTDSEPSPLSLAGRLNIFRGKAGPGRALLPSISEVGSSDFNRFRTDIPAPRFAGNTQELTKARLGGPLDSPIRIPATMMSGNRLSDSGVSPSMQTKRIFDISPHRGRLGSQGGSQSRTGDEVRFGASGLTTLDPHVRNILYQAASTDFELQTEGYGTGLSGQTEDQSTQTRITESKANAAKYKSSAERTVQYSSIAWWLLLLHLALFWWFSQSDRQVWMQANEATRQSVLALRDESWAKPSWLARMSFDAENVLDIDRSTFG